MTVRFLHIADTHLGYRQYNRVERLYDFSNAFFCLLQKGLNESVDFVLLAGDMFNDADVSPDALSDICTRFFQFREKCRAKLNREIPIIAIEGNHDYRGYNVENSWLHFLAGLGLFYLLTEKYDHVYNKLTFSPISEETHTGGMIRIKDACIYGVSYKGSNTTKILPLIYNAIPTPTTGTNILLMHFGIEGQVEKKKGELFSEDLKKLHEKVDYLALGHFHKQYFLPDIDPWIFNPGSIEIVDSTEFFSQFDRGGFLITLTPNEPQIITCQAIKAISGGEDSRYTIPNRPIIPLRDPVTVGGESETSFDITKTNLINKLTKHGIPLKTDSSLKSNSNSSLPMLYLLVRGSLVYSRLEFNTNILRKEIIERFNIFECRIYTLVTSKMDDIQGQFGEKISPEEIENQVFSDLVKTNPLYQPFVSEIVEIIQQTKGLILKSKNNSDKVKDLVRDWYFTHFSSQDPSFATVFSSDSPQPSIEKATPPIKAQVKQTSAPKQKKRHTASDFE